MPQVRIILSREHHVPISAEFEYDERDLPKEIAGSTVAVSVGEGTSYGSISLPLDVLTLVMGRVMAKAGSKGELVIPKPPSIVMPGREP